MGTLGTILLGFLIWTLGSIPLGILAGKILRYSGEVKTIGPNSRNRIDQPRIVGARS
jgi:hypothetical protein